MTGTVTTVTIPPSLDVAPGLLAMRPRAVMGAILRQPLSVWAVNLYVFFEYVRPQSIYPAFNFIPWSQISLLSAVGLAAVSDLGKRRWTMGDTAMALFTLTLFASLLTAFDPQAGYDALNVYLSWVLVYFAITTAVNTQSRMVLLLLGWFLWNFKMAFFAFRSWASVGFGFRDWGVVGAPGWFANSGEFGIQMCVIFPIAFYFALGVRQKVRTPTFLALMVLPFLAVAGTIASSSRGALLGVAAVGLWMLLRSRYKVRGTLLLAAFAVAIYSFIPAEQKGRIEGAGEDNTSVSRLMYWKRGVGFANDNPILGIGYRSWIAYYNYTWGDKLLQRQKVQLPHNFLIEALAELGYPGLIAALFLLFANFLLNAKTRTLARRLGSRGALAENLAAGFDGGMIGFAVSGFFVTVLYYPYLWVNLAMTVALHLSVSRAARAADRAARLGVAHPVPSTR